MGHLKKLGAMKPITYRVDENFPDEQMNRHSRFYSRFRGKSLRKEKAVKENDSYFTDLKSLAESNDWDENFFSGMGLAGYVLSSAWGLLAYYCSSIFPQSIQSQFDIQLSRIVFIVMLMLAEFVIWRLSSYWSSDKRLHLLVLLGFFCSPWNCIVALIPLEIPPVLLWCAWGVSGLGYACMISLWSRFLCRLQPRRLAIYMMSTTVLNGSLFLIVSYMQYTPGIIVAFTLPITSLLLYIFTLRGLKKRVVMTCTPKQAHETIKIKPFLASFLYSIGMGAAGCCATFSLRELETGDFFLGLVFLVAGSIVFFSNRHHDEMIKKIMSVWTLPISLACILPLPVLNPYGRVFCCITLLTFYFVRSIINRRALGEVLSYRAGFTVGAFAYGRLANTGGILLGWVIMFFAFVSKYAGFNMQLVSVVVIGIIFVSLGSYIIADYYPVPPVLKEDEKGRWRLRCEKIAESYGLSPRQTEVLILLAKGRNAKYIEKELFLSSYTVRTHIYTIYKKMSVHSHQDLLNVISKGSST